MGLPCGEEGTRTPAVPEKRKPPGHRFGRAVAEQDNPDELIAGFDKVHAPADRPAVAAKRAKLTGSASNTGAAA
ncbi:hypothetical protein [Streptomyces sp. NPDC002172]